MAAAVVFRKVRRGVVMVAPAYHSMRVRGVEGDRKGAGRSRPRAEEKNRSRWEIKRP